MGRQIVTTRQARLGEAATVDDYKDKLLKLIPTEITTAYVTIFGIISGISQGNKDDLLWLIIVLLAILNPLYLWRISKVKSWLQIIFTSVAFLLWVLATGSPIATIFGYQSTFIGSILLIVYTLFIPLLFPSKEPNGSN
jgi:hypothetical protein